MARLFSSGFELNSSTSNVEWSQVDTTPTFSTTTVRSGIYSMRISGLSSGLQQGHIKVFKLTATLGPIYGRAYLRIATAPSATTVIFQLIGTNHGNGVSYISLNSSNQLIFNDDDGQVGSASPALSLNTWYRIEILYDHSGSAGNFIARARIDGVEFAVRTNGSAITTGIDSIAVGGNLNNEVQTQGEWFFDDIAVNDNNGTSNSTQTSYPGDSKIIHLNPNAAGDANSFATQTGGTAGSANNFTRVNEIPPNDATSFNGSNTLNQEDLFNMGDSGIGSTDRVNVVSVGVRFRNNIADATTAMKLEIEKSGSGTIAQSSAIICNSITWNTNSVTAPQGSPLIAYQDPDGANWTQAALDSMQAGYKITTGGTNRIEVSNLWVMVDYTPASVSTASIIVLKG